MGDGGPGGFGVGEDEQSHGLIVRGGGAGFQPVMVLRCWIEGVVGWWCGGGVSPGTQCYGGSGCLAKALNDTD